MTPLRLIPAMLLAALPAVAHADLALVTSTYDNAFGEPPAYQEIVVSGAGTNGGGYLWAGTLNVSATEFGDIEAYCIEIPQGLALPAFYQRTNNPFSAAQSDRLSRLFTGYYDSVETPTERAAFQVAVWEITVDGTPDLDAGGFQIVENQEVIRTARAFLASLEEFEPEYEMIYLESNTSQDVVAGMPRSDVFQGF